MVKCIGLYGTIEKIKTDIHVLFIHEDTKIFEAQIKTFGESIMKIVKQLRSRDDFHAKNDEEEMIHIDGERYLLVGLGLQSKMSLEMLRRAAARAAKKCLQYSAKMISLYLSEKEFIENTLKISFDDAMQACVEGATLALYTFDVFKEKKKDSKKAKIETIQFITSDKNLVKNIQEIISRTTIICEGVELARNLSNTPGNKLNADDLSKEAVQRMKDIGVKTLILKKKEIEKQKMGGLLAVNRGSKNEPRFIIMEYNMGIRNYPCVALVGKGVMFDSGGISIKPAANMSEMKMDMSGAATVIATMQTIARLKLPVRVVGLIPATDNMPSGSAMCPGDIIQISNGKFVEVDNTDAEGRLILADALVYAQRYKPDAIIDLATLTGAVVVALGEHVTGMMGTDDNLKSKLKQAGEKTFERVCELPLYDEYEKQIKSDVADIKNLGGRWAGAITAGMFLKHFVGEYPWVHLDIAGTAILEENGYYTQKGGSGVGVRLLTEFFSNVLNK